MHIFHLEVSEEISPSPPQSCTQNELVGASLEGLYQFVGAFFKRCLQQLFDVHSGIELRLDVNQWIFGTPLVVPPGTPAPLSFQHCCDVLDVDAAELRVQIQGYLVQTGIVDLVDERRMGVRTKVRSPNAHTDQLGEDHLASSFSDWMQLMIFADDDADFVPPPLPRRRRSRAGPPETVVRPKDTQMSLLTTT